MASTKLFDLTCTYDPLNKDHGDYLFNHLVALERKYNVDFTKEFAEFRDHSLFIDRNVDRFLTDLANSASKFLLREDLLSIKHKLRHITVIPSTGAKMNRKYYIRFTGKSFDKNSFMYLKNSLSTINRIEKLLTTQELTTIFLEIQTKNNIITNKYKSINSKISFEEYRVYQIYRHIVYTISQIKNNNRIVFNFAVKWLDEFIRLTPEYTNKTTDLDLEYFFKSENKPRVNFVNDPASIQSYLSKFNSNENSQDSPPSYYISTLPNVVNCESKTGIVGKK